MSYRKANKLAVILWRRDWYLWTRRVFQAGYYNRSWRRHMVT